MATLFFILGLIVGSFLNALIHRLHSGQSIVYDRSRCVHCKHLLSVWDLVPLFSFVLLRGKCRYCGKKISWQYPIVELATALIFILLAKNFEFQIADSEFWFQLVFACFLIVIAVYDLKHYLILDKVLVPASILASIYAVYKGEFWAGLIGVIIISGFFGLQYLASKGRWIGLGDVKLGIFLGLIFGVGQSLMLLLIAYCTGALVGIILIMKGQRQMSSQLPFGTFLAISAIIMLIYGPSLLAWYIRLLGL